MRLPAGVMLEIFGDMFGNQNVTRIATIHHALRNVNTSSGDIGPVVHVCHEVDWTAVDSLFAIVVAGSFYGLGDLQRTSCRRFRTTTKNQRYAITGRQ